MQVAIVAGSSSHRHGWTPPSLVLNLMTSNGNGPSGKNDARALQQHIVWDHIRTSGQKDVVHVGAAHLGCHN